MNKKVIVFGGGKGLSELLLGLKMFPVDITAVITVSDDGKSTGILREEFSMPAMGDIRKVIVSLSDVDKDVKKMLDHRFETYSDLNGHPLGNLMLVALYNMTGRLKESIETISKLLNIKHKVLPLSEDNLILMGETSKGEILTGQFNIMKSGKKVKKLFYQDNPRISKDVLSAISKADMIVFSMGSLFTSILPHIISDEIRNAIDNSKAKLTYTCNCVTQPGETDNFTVSNHIKTINSYLGIRKVECVFAATSAIPKEIIEKYANEEQKDLVEIDEEKIAKLKCKLIKSDMLIIKNNMIRHKSLKLATLLFNYLME